MPYILAYLLILLDISILPSILEPFVVWSLGYLIIISNLYKKDPLDPRIWLFLGVGILLINGFSGILYVPSNINEQRIIIYVMLTIFSFHLGFGKLENANYAILLRRRLRNVFNSYSSYSNKIHVLLGLLGIIGSLMICFEMFVLLGVSMDDGGERRRQFQELFPLMVLTPIGTILLGGSFPSIFSVFCGGSKINILLGLVNILALALSSMAIAGKQGILFVTLILAYIYFFHKCYRIKIKIPVYVKYCIFAFIYLFVLYIWINECALWFIPVLFFAEIFSYFIIRYINSNCLILLTAITIGTIGYMLYFFNIHFPYNIDVSFYASFFYLIGYISKNKIIHYPPKHSLAICLLIVNIILSQILPRTDMAWNNCGWYGLNAINAIGGTFAIILITKTYFDNIYATPIKLFFKWAGHNTIIILGLSQIISTYIKSDFHIFLFPKL